MTITDEQIKNISSTRSSTSLSWAGFALTVFIGLLGVYSALGIELVILFQLAEFFLMLSGTSFVLSWGFYEKLSSGLEITPKKVFLGILFKRVKNLSNIRIFYYAEFFTLIGTLFYFMGFATFLLYLNLSYLFWLWVIIVVIAMLIVLPIYYGHYS